MYEHISKVGPIVVAIVSLTIIIGIAFLILGQIGGVLANIEGENSTSVQAVNDLRDTLRNIVVPLATIIVIVAMVVLIFMLLKQMNIGF
ncbi:MAG: hypothetical protein QW607_05880 [Desulfurococcaceae archaeon]